MNQTEDHYEIITPHRSCKDSEPNRPAIALGCLLAIIVVSAIMFVLIQNYRRKLHRAKKDKDKKILQKSYITSPKAQEKDIPLDTITSINRPNPRVYDRPNTSSLSIRENSWETKPLYEQDAQRSLDVRRQSKQLLLECEVVELQRKIKDHEQTWAQSQKELAQRDCEVSELRTRVKHLAAQEVGMETILHNLLRRKDKLHADIGRINYKKDVKDFPPKFKKYIGKTITVDSGKKLTLNVEVEGSPVPFTRWLRGDDVIIESDQVQFLVKLQKQTLSHALFISNPTPDWSGQYTCIASNEAGKVTDITTVSVTPPIKEDTVSTKSDG